MPPERNPKNRPARRSLLFLLTAMLLFFLSQTTSRRNPQRSSAEAATASRLRTQPRACADRFFILRHAAGFLGGLLLWVLIVAGLFALVYGLLAPTVKHLLIASSTASPTTFTTKVYESQSLVAATTSLILTGIAISIPVIMLMWSQLTDSLNHLYHTLSPSSQGKNLASIRRLFRQARALNDFAVKYLPHLLYAVAAILLQLLLVLILPVFRPSLLSPLTGKTAFYYLFLAYSASMTGFAALSFVFFLYCVLKVRIVTTKVAIQLATLGYDIDV